MSCGRNVDALPTSGLFPHFVSLYTAGYTPLGIALYHAARHCQSPGGDGIDWGEFRKYVGASPSFGQGKNDSIYVRVAQKCPPQTGLYIQSWVHLMEEYTCITLAIDSHIDYTRIRTGGFGIYGYTMRVNYLVGHLKRKKNCRNNIRLRSLRCSALCAQCIHCAPDIGLFLPPCPHTHTPRHQDFLPSPAPYCTSRSQIMFSPASRTLSTLIAL